ncbi:MAG TPA: tetratricopeptide repeat protein, partial [Candidatus Eisenbacteria bacterium]|nr:tetratricopeptide repeat protein [Candidatus Eisenbacteria bacterium]
MSKSSQLRQKAQDHLKKGKVSEAIEAYKKLLQVEPRNANLFNELGDIYLKADERLQAVSSFEKAVENYEKVALYNNAVAVCKKILRVVPNRLESIFKLGELKAKQKFSGEASRLFIQYFDMIAADENGARPETVLPRVEMVLGLVPDDDELHAKSADVLTGLGLKTAAAEVFANLMVKSSKNGDSGRGDFYRGRLDLLRGSLSDKEQARIETILAGCLDMADKEIADGEPDLTVEEIDTTAAA